MELVKQTEELDEPLNANDLPEGWAQVSLGRIAEQIQYGYTASAIQSEGPRFLRITDIQDGRVDWSSVPSCEITRDDAEKYRLMAGDIVFARTGATTGKSFLIGFCPPAVFASYLIRVRTHQVVAPAFLSFFLNTPPYWEFITDNIAGNAQPNCNATKLAALQIPIAPAAEQKRIVAKVEALLAEVNRVRARLEKVPKILKAFRQSVLAAACSGRLTEDWRNNNPNVEPAQGLVAGIRNSHEKAGLGHGGQAASPTEDVHTLSLEDFPETWGIEELKWLCEPGRPITYGILKPGLDRPNGIPYIRVADFPGNRLNLNNIRRTNPEIAHQYRRSALKSGDVLLSIRGTVGRVCRVPTILEGANITQDTARISVHPKLVPEHVELYLQCPSAQRRLEAAMKGVAVRGVNIGDVRALQVAVPPHAEQKEIVRRVEDLFKLAGTIEKQVESATKRAEKITQAILAKAFRGELVPTEAELAHREARPYEPASILLERIKSEQKAKAADATGGAR
jgi:type I restriction enzyme S subunit